MSHERKFNRRDFAKLFGVGSLLFLASCAPKIPPKETVSPLPKNTETPTLLPSETPTFTKTPISADTSTPSETPTPTPTENKELFLESPVHTPPSLMLHSEDLPQLTNLLPMLEQAGYQALTYENYYEALLNKRPLRDPILLSLDDLGITYLSPGQKGMILAMDKIGMCGTLGIVTRGTRKEAKTEIWQYLKRLQDKGWELAIHTENHVSLPPVSEATLRYQIKEPYDEILEATGKAPVSLILPYGIVTKKGTGEMDQRIFQVCKELKIRWVVGVGGGRQFRGESPFYVGRMSPGKTAGITMKYLANFFKNG